LVIKQRQQRLGDNTGRLVDISLTVDATICHDADHFAEEWKKTPEGEQLKAFYLYQHEHYSTITMHDTW